MVETIRLEASLHQYNYNVDHPIIIKTSQLQHSTLTLAIGHHEVSYTFYVKGNTFNCRWKSNKDCHLY